MLESYRRPHSSPCCSSDFHELREQRAGSSFLARLRLFLAPTHGRPLRVGQDIDPLWVRSGLSVVIVVPVPPFVRRGLRITLWRILPSLLTAERSDVEVAPDCSHRLVAAVINEVCVEHPVVVAEEHVVAVPFIYAKVLVETVSHGVPGHLPTHPRLQPGNVRLRRTRRPCEGRIASIQVGQM